MGAKLRLPNPYFCSVWLQKGPSFCRTEALSARNAGFEAIFGQNGIFTREGLKKWTATKLRLPNPCFCSVWLQTGAFFLQN